MVTDAEESGGPDHCRLRPPEAVTNARNSLSKSWSANNTKGNRRNPQLLVELDKMSKVPFMG